MYKILLLIIKIIFVRATILTLPIPLIVILICFLIVNLRIYHFKCLLGNYTFIFESYDLLRKSLVLLSIWLIMLMIIAQKKVNYKKLLLINMIVLLVRLVFTFNTTNIIIFYFFFEWSLIPIFFIIIGWGYQPERLKASLSLFFYTLFASLPLLISIVIIINWSGSVKLRIIITQGMPNFLWTITVLAFLVKFPMYFVHLWLPKAHVEAPVSGSIILAGVLLKLGGYGIIRLIRVTNIRIISSQIIALALIGGGILGVLCIVQRDIKVVIAYSSVVHIALVIAGRLRLTKWGFEGVLIIILAHGVCSSGIFAAANMIYERRHSRRFFFNSGLLNRRAIFRIVWFVLIVANFGGPFTYNLLGEILLILNLSSLAINSLSVVLFLSFFSAAYRLILYRSTNQGQTGNNNSVLIKVRFSEMIILISHRWRLLFLCIFMYMV